MSQGKGISDAVRESIRDWITPDVASKISSAANGNIQTYLLRDAKSWVRRVRRGIANGWQVDYDCKGFGGRVGLRVHTDAADRYIKHATLSRAGSASATAAASRGIAFWALPPLISAISTGRRSSKT